MITLSALALALPLMGVGVVKPEPSWREALHHQLPLLGHRNWIVIADSAYPWQTSPGIDTVETGADQLEVTKAVLAALGHTTHVRPTIYLDSELPFVPESDAKGVQAYRRDLAKVLGKHKATSLAHEKIIAKLDETGKTFHVLLLKTKLTIPYTSVFIQLDCGYWGDAAEKRLRETMKKAGH